MLCDWAAKSNNGTPTIKLLLLFDSRSKQFGMIQVGRFFSKTAHGSRFERAEGYNGIMKKKTSDVIIGAMLGIMSGKSVTANWTDCQFILRPGENREPARLEFTEIGADEHGVLLINYRSVIQDNGTSKNGNFKFMISGKTEQGETVNWELKVKDQKEYDGWLRALKDCTKARWEQNTQTCGVCKKSFGLLETHHHCRRCGGCVCNGCSPGSRVLTTEGPFPVRVCNPCFKEAPITEGVLG
jgi:hypothetical protein